MKYDFAEALAPIFKPSIIDGKFHPAYHQLRLQGFMPHS
jgi:hypothetical protein